MGALEALSGELAAAASRDAEIAEIKALTFEMLAVHARRDLPALLPAEPRDPRADQRWPRATRLLTQDVRSAQPAHPEPALPLQLRPRQVGPRRAGACGDGGCARGARRAAPRRDPARRTCARKREAVLDVPAPATRPPRPDMNARCLPPLRSSRATREPGSHSGCAAALARRGAVRRGVARPLLDRRVDLPGRAGRRAWCRAATTTCARRSTSAASSACRCCRAARAAPVRPDGGRGAGRSMTAST